MKKIFVLIIILLISFFSYCLVVLLPRDYLLTYKLDKYNIEERYNKKLDYYTFIIKDESNSYPIITTDKYSSKRKKITSIDEVIDGDFRCITVHIEDNVYPVCKSKTQLVDYRLTSDIIKESYSNLIVKSSTEVIQTYEGLKIYNYLDASYFVWNYKGYYYLNKDENKTIDIVENDNYENGLATKIDSYLITPNYDSKYYFDEYLVINTKNLELTSFHFERDISYSSYVMGNYDKELFLVDKKSKVQYKLNIKNSKIKVIGTDKKNGVWYNNGWADISLTKLVNNEYTFISDVIYNYELIDNQLYLVIDDYKVLVSESEIKDIIYADKSSVYYIVNNVLYVYNYEVGEVKLIENKEWSFNYTNKIFIFD